MAHIPLAEGIPGILGPVAFSPETAKPLNELADVLLRGPSSLSPADRELIATYVSSQNDCYFCQRAHGAVAAYRLGGNEKLVDEVKANFQSAPIRSQGAGDKEIHDTVLIAAAFCMYDRYVDGLATWAPTDPQMYRENGKRLAEHGYVAATANLAGA